MKIKNIAAVTFLLSTLLVLMSCGSKENPKAEDFSFIYEEYSCGHLPLLNVLDTSKGILIHTPLGKSESVVIPLVLTDHEIETIYQKVISTIYFDYPAEVRVPGPVPSSTFRLQVINGNLRNDVKWTTDYNFLPNYPEDDDLIELFRLIQDTIRTHPEYPKPNAFCL